MVNGNALQRHIIKTQTRKTGLNSKKDVLYCLNWSLKFCFCRNIKSNKNKINIKRRIYIEYFKYKCTALRKVTANTQSSYLLTKRYFLDIWTEILNTAQYNLLVYYYLVKYAQKSMILTKSRVLSYNYGK